MSSIYLIDHYANKDLPFQNISTYFKLIFFILILFSIVFSGGFFTLFLIIGVIYILTLFSGLPVKKVFKWALYPTFFALIFTISQIETGLAYRTLLRAFSAASLSIFFSFCTPYRETFGIISKISPFLGSMLFLTYRYFFVFVSGVERKIKILKVRGGNKKKLKTIGKTIGFFVINFLTRAERIYKILKIRGFKGKIGRPPALKVSVTDILILIVGALIFSINLTIYYV